jgi:hypothetical protein
MPTCPHRSSQDFSAPATCGAIGRFASFPITASVVQPDACAACLSIGRVPNTVIRDVAVSIALAHDRPQVAQNILALSLDAPLPSLPFELPAMTPPDLTCPHRGEVSHQALCDVCGGVIGKGQPFDVFACAKHGACSLQRMRQDVRPCVTCHDLPWHVQRAAEFAHEHEDSHASQA